MNLLFSVGALFLGFNAFGADSFDFTFKIQADRFHLEIHQQFPRTLTEVRRGLNPKNIPSVSNVVRSTQSNPLKNGVSQVSVTGVKHGFSRTTVNLCKETLSATEWKNHCELDLDSGDTGDTFRSGRETIECKSNAAGTACIFIVDAEVLTQKFLFISRSAEILALGGIGERLHDQGVLGRMLVQNESAAVAKENFEASSENLCINSVYATYESKASRNAYWKQPLEVSSKTACR